MWCKLFDCNPKCKPKPDTYLFIFYRLIEFLWNFWEVGLSKQNLERTSLAYTMTTNMLITRFDHFTLKHLSSFSSNYMLSDQARKVGCQKGFVVFLYGFYFRLVLNAYLYV